MSEIKAIIAACFVACVIFGAAIAVSVSVWSECRSAGHSVFYCMKLISR